MSVHNATMILVLGLASCATEPTDRDGDGVNQGRDCDDRDADRFPGNADLVGDGVDNNCDGIDGVDADGDGVPSAESGGMDCDDLDPDSLGPDGDGDGVASCVDCNDADPTVFPGGVELCNQIDDDCDGEADLSPVGEGVCSQSFAAGSAIDVLFLIDNSCSMADEQALLAGSAHVLTDVLLNSGFDYHVGVISTDMADPSQSGKLRQASGVRWVEPTTPDRDAVLNQMLMLGTGGSADEKGREAVYSALETQGGINGYNEGFSRSHAALDIVVLSDEDDHSFTLTTEEFTDWLGTHRAGPAAFHSIVSDDPPCPVAQEPGLQYLALTDATGGVFWSICDGQFEGAMSAIAERHDPVGQQTFVLVAAVDPASLAASVVDGSGTTLVHYPVDQLQWDPAANSVTLPEPVPGDAALWVWYRVLP